MPGDENRCAQIIQACLPTMFGVNEAAKQYLFTKNEPIHLLTELAHYYTIVLIDNGVIKGLGALDGEEIKRVYVDPSQQGRGYGKTIMTKLEAEAQRRKKSKLTLQSSLRAEHFYQGCGFRSLGVQRLVREQLLFEYVLMEKTLGEEA